MFEGRTIRVQPLDGGIFELCFDRQDESINKLDKLTIEELREALALMRDHPAARGLLISSSKSSFIVGADINELAELMAQDQSRIARVNAEQSAVLTQLEALPFPTVAMIGGLALGGGFELSLACDYRILAREAQVGLPEVGLGLFPALGGSVRLPRLVGERTALAWIASARPNKAEVALHAGAVDAVVASDELRQTALLQLTAASWPARRLQRLKPRLEVDAHAFHEARDSARKTHPHISALLEAINLIERSIRLDRDAALELEASAFSRVLKSQAANALVRVYLNEQQLKRKAREYARISSPPARAGVLGAGIMGGGIAYTSAVRGTAVLMKDISEKALDLGMAEANKLLNKQITSGRMSTGQAGDILDQIQPTLDYTGFDQVDVVVEAVVENQQVKQQVLAEVERCCRPDSVLASNTSSLSIGTLAGSLKRPQNFVGMHFFNPVPVMPLVEVICGPDTSEVAAARIASYAAAMGKTAVVVQDCPGFLVNRILTAYILAFLRLVRDGADFVEIDHVMQAFGWPMGPAYLQDVVGMDTSIHVIEHISRGYGERLLPGYRHAVEHMVELGRYGQKNGLGFYRYEADPGGKPRKSPTSGSQVLLQSIQPGGRKPFSEEEIIERMMLPMIIEAARSLEEGVAASAEEIDMALILGIGLPRHLGGALVYADWLGMDEVLQQCSRYAALGGLYEPTQRMRDMAAKGTLYYG